MLRVAGIHELFKICVVTLWELFI